MHGAGEHHERDGSSYGQSDRPPMRAKDCKEQKTDQRAYDVASNDISWLSEWYVRIAKHNHTRSAERPKNQRDGKKVR